jgi:hypothetical protein
MTTFIVKFNERITIHGDSTLAKMFPALVVGTIVEAVNYDHAIELAAEKLGITDDAQVFECKPLASQVAA